MEKEKKQIKISLKLAIIIAIVVVLIAGAVVYAIINKNSNEDSQKENVITENKEEVKEPIKEKIQIVEENNKYGIINIETEEKIIETKYDNIEIDKDGIVTVTTKGTKEEYAVINKENGKVTKKMIEAETKYGKIDLETGNLILDVIYDEIGVLYNEKGVANNDYIKAGKIKNYILEDGDEYPNMLYGIFDLNDTVLLNLECNFEPYIICGNYGYVEYGGQGTLLGRAVNIKTGEEIEVIYESEPYWGVKKDNKYGVINPETDEIILEFKYDDMIQYNENLVIIKENGKYGVINYVTKEELIDISHDRIKKIFKDDTISYFAITDNGKTNVYTDELKIVLENSTCESIQIINNSNYWAAINSKGYIEILNENGNLIKAFNIKIDLNKEDIDYSRFNEEKNEYIVSVYEKEWAVPTKVFSLNIETGKYNEENPALYW